MNISKNITAVLLLSLSLSSQASEDPDNYQAMTDAEVDSEISEISVIATQAESNIFFSEEDVVSQNTSELESVVITGVKARYCNDKSTVKVRVRSHLLKYNAKKDEYFAEYCNERRKLIRVEDPISIAESLLVALGHEDPYVMQSNRKKCYIDGGKKDLYVTYYENTYITLKDKSKDGQTDYLCTKGDSVVASN